MNNSIPDRAHRFVGSRVIVTGGASGIGRELVELFLDEGASVAAIDRETAGIPSAAIAIKADLGRGEEVTRSIESAISQLGGVDTLCNNAGIGSTLSVVDETADWWDQVFAVNVRAVFLGIQAVIPTMLAQGSGSIVNTASAAAMIGLPDRAAYSASKGAVISLTKQVAVQYAASGIRCNTVCPGTVDSPWVKRLTDAADDPETRRAQLIARQPMGRLAEPREVALAIAYLASSDAAFVTGTDLVIDGGIVAG